MKDEKLMKELFEAARNEEPRISHAQLADKFLHVADGSLLHLVQEWLKKISLNQILLFLGVGASLILLGLWMQGDSEQIGSPEAKSENQLIEIQVPEKEDLLEKEIVQLEASELKEKPAEAGTTFKREKSKIQRDPVQELAKEEILPEDQLARSVGEAPMTGQGQDRKLDSLAKLQESISGQLDSSSKIDHEIHQSAPTSIPEEISISYTEVDWVLKRTDDQYALKLLKNKLEATGLELRTKAKFNQDNTSMDHIELKFKHAEGMNFKLRGTGFQTLSFSVKVNANGGIQSFKYRFNDEAYTLEIPLNCTGEKNYIYGEGFSGKHGTTNINIEH